MGGYCAISLGTQINAEGAQINADFFDVEGGVLKFGKADRATCEIRKWVGFGTGVLQRNLGCIRFKDTKIPVFLEGCYKDSPMKRGCIFNFVIIFAGKTGVLPQIRKWVRLAFVV
jgi:hypothetical protein